MTMAQRLKRVFAIGIQKREKCGGCVRIIASIEAADAIRKILIYLGFTSHKIQGIVHCHRIRPVNNLP